MCLSDRYRSICGVEGYGWIIGHWSSNSIFGANKVDIFGYVSCLKCAVMKVRKIDDVKTVILAIENLLFGGEYLFQ